MATLYRDGEDEMKDERTGEWVLDKDNTCRFSVVFLSFFLFFLFLLLFFLSVFHFLLFFLSLIKANVFSCILPSFVSKNKSPGSTRDGKVSELVKCLLAIFASLETTTIVRGCKRQSSTKSRTKKKK